MRPNPSGGERASVSVAATLDRNLHPHLVVDLVSARKFSPGVVPTCVSLDEGGRTRRLRRLPRVPTRLLAAEHPILILL